MSIYYYVTRKRNPLEANGPDISAEEWIDLVKGDPDLSIADPPNRLSGGRGRGNYAVWNSYPGGYPAWFCLCAGSVEVKGIDDTILAKLHEFAAKLDARVVSETGEEWW